MKWILVAVVAVLACGCTLLPKVEIQLDPARRTLSYRTSQETDVVVGQIEYREQADGTRAFTAGTTTQPAFVYGSRAVEVIQANVAIIDAYTRLHAQLGDNADKILKDIPGIISAAEWIGGVISGLGNASAAVRIQSEIIDPLKRFQSNLEQIQALAKQCPNGSCTTP